MAVYLATIESDNLLNGVEFSLETRHIITTYTAATRLRSISIATTLNEQTPTDSQSCTEQHPQSNMLTHVNLRQQRIEK